MNTPTQEQLEQIRALRKLIEAIEAGSSVEMNVGSRANPKWATCALCSFLDQTTWYRAKLTPPPAPRFYTVEELIKAGARYMHVCTAIYTIIYMSAAMNSLAIITNKQEDHDPCWFHHRDFKWSADGREWKSFTKED